MESREETPMHASGSVYSTSLCPYWFLLVTDFTFVLEI